MSQFSDRYYVKLLTQVIDRECTEALESFLRTKHHRLGGEHDLEIYLSITRNLVNMMAESAKAKRMLKEASDAMEETTWED